MNQKFNLFIWEPRKQRKIQMKKKLTPIAIDRALELSECLIIAIIDLKRPLQRKTDPYFKVWKFMCL